MFISVRCQVGFQSFGKFTAGEQDVPPTALAFETDIRAKAGDGPFIGAAGMLFAQAQMVLETQVREHRKQSLAIEVRRDYYKLNRDKLRATIFVRGE